MTETIQTVVQQLEAEHDRLSKLFKQKQTEAHEIKVEVDRVQVALTALTSPTRTNSPAKPNVSRAGLLAIVHQALTTHGGQLEATALREAVKRSLKSSGLSARGLHKSLPHVLAHKSLRVDGETVKLQA